MSWQEFVLGLVQAVVWPATIGFGVWKARNLLRALSARLLRDISEGRPVKASVGGVSVGLEDSRSLELEDTSQATVGIWLPGTFESGAQR